MQNIFPLITEGYENLIDFYNSQQLSTPGGGGRGLCPCMGPDPFFISHSQPNTTFFWPIVFILMLRLCSHKTPGIKGNFPVGISLEQRGGEEEREGAGPGSRSRVFHSGIPPGFSHQYQDNLTRKERQVALKERDLRRIIKLMIGLVP
jgi:hypothetical protein